MKGQVSRYAVATDNGYSGVFQLQGGMVTDADLGETSAIARERVDRLGGHAVLSGVPRIGGMLSFGADAVPQLQSGAVYAGGVRGMVSFGDGDASPISRYRNQADYPEPPNLPNGPVQFYVDVWERPVFALEQPDLADPGLLGAETSFRSKTVAQLRWAPRDAVLGGPDYPRCGTARLSVVPGNIQPGNAIDPAAEVVSSRLLNTLFRVEVIQIAGTASAPTRLSLAWAADNAALQVGRDQSLPPGFDDEPQVFQHFSVTTESQMGAFANYADRKQSRFSDDLGGDEPFIRAWDGYADIDLAAGVVGQTLGVDTVSLQGRAVGIRTSLGQMTLDLDNASVLPGDFWLIEVREHAAQQVRVLNRGLPAGIEHHYCALFTFDNGLAQPVSARERMRLAFAPLAGLAGDDIAFVPPEGLPFDSPPTTVHDALVQLARRPIDDGEQAAVGYADLFDWGVVTGLDVTPAGPRGVSISAGSFLTRDGRFLRSPAIPIDTIGILAGAPGANASLVLVLDIADNNRVTTRLVAASEAFGGDDPSLGDKARATLSDLQNRMTNGVIDLEQFRSNERHYRLMKKVVAASVIAGPSNPAQNLLSLDQPDFETAAHLISERVNALDFLEGPAKVEYETSFNNLVSLGNTQNISNIPAFRGRRIVEMVRLTVQSARQQLREAIVRALVVPPVPQGGPQYIPLAGLDLQVADGQVTIRQVNLAGARKQALTPRAMRYRLGGGRTNDYAPFGPYATGVEGYEAMLTRLGGFTRPDVFLDLGGVTEPTEPPDVVIPEPPPDNNGGDIYPWEIPPHRREKWPPRIKFEPGRPRDDLIFPVSPGDVVRPGIDLTLPGQGNYRVSTVQQAREAVLGYGAEVKEQIDLGQADQFDRLVSMIPGQTLGEQLNGGVQIAPGDQVALLTRGGQIAGLAVIGRRDAAFPVSLSTAILADKASTFEQTLDKVDASKAKLLESIGELELRYDNLVREVDAMEAKRKALDVTVTTVNRKFETMLDIDAQTKRIRDAVDVQFNSLRDDIEANLDTFQKEQEVRLSEVLQSVASKVPVTVALAGEQQEVIEAVRRAGFESVGDMINASEERKMEMLTLNVFADRNQLDTVFDKVSTLYNVRGRTF